MVRVITILYFILLTVCLHTLHQYDFASRRCFSYRLYNMLLFIFENFNGQLKRNAIIIIYEVQTRRQMRNGNGLYIKNAIDVYSQFYLPVFVFLHHRSSLNKFLTRFLLYIFLIELNNTAPRGISLSTEDTEH